MRTPRPPARHLLSTVAALAVALLGTPAAGLLAHGPAHAAHAAHAGEGLAHGPTVEVPLAAEASGSHGDAGHDSESCGVCRLISQLRAGAPVPCVDGPIAAPGRSAEPLAPRPALRSAPHPSGAGPRAPPGVPPLA